MKKKGFRIGVLIDQLIPGGVQNAAINEVLYLNKLGFEATLLVLEKSNQPPVPLPYLANVYLIKISNGKSAAGRSGFLT